MVSSSDVTGDTQKDWGLAESGWAKTARRGVGGPLVPDLHIHPRSFFCIWDMHIFCKACKA
eukprot:1155545-Pelagomonas_calceolata.AAC.8